MKIKILVFLSLLVVTAVTVILGPRTTPIYLQQADTDHQPRVSPSDSQSSEVNQGASKLQFGGEKAISISPLRLARTINGNKRNWDKRQIYEELDLKPVWNVLGNTSDNLQECQANCKAQIFRVTLTGRADNEILLKVTNSDFCRYLVFQPTRTAARSQTAWRFLGHIDHAFNKYEMSWHRIIALGNKRFLVIRGQTGSGTGFSSYDDTWYEVSEKGIKAVLNYTARAHIAQVAEGRWLEVELQDNHTRCEKRKVGCCVVQSGFQRTQLHDRALSVLVLERDGCPIYVGFSSAQIYARPCGDIESQENV